MSNKCSRLLESFVDAFGYEYESDKEHIEECDALAGGINMGDVADGMEKAGLSNSTQLGMNVDRGIRKHSKASKLLKGLKRVKEAMEDDEEKQPGDDEVVAEIKQEVTKGDIRKANQVLDTLANTGKADQNTVNQAKKTLDSIK